MKKELLSVIGCFAFIFAGNAVASVCENGSCTEISYATTTCNPFETNCQCTDPICNKYMYSDCISRAYCCEAFGNPGGR
jgi:hypothetical protein